MTTCPVLPTVETAMLAAVAGAGFGFADCSSTRTLLVMAARDNGTARSQPTPTSRGAMAADISYDANRQVSLRCFCRRGGVITVTMNRLACYRGLGDIYVVCGPTRPCSSASADIY